MQKQTKVLLAIKPEFAEKIFAGEKKFEFRKSLFKSREVRTVVVYASSPVQRVIGEFELGGIISELPETLWERTKDFAGITKDYFDSYFASRAIAHAIKIENACKYDQPLSLKEDFMIEYAPQSFLYLRNL